MCHQQEKSHTPLQNLTLQFLFLKFTGCSVGESETEKDAVMKNPRDVDSVAVALGLLSAQCASVIQRSTREHGSTSQFRNTVLCSNDPQKRQSPTGVSDFFAESDSDEKGGEAIIQLLLEKIGHFERKTSIEYIAMEKENVMLREALQVPLTIVNIVQYCLVLYKIV